MKLLMTGVAFLMAITLVPTEALADVGKDVFLALKCNKCHTVKSQGIELIKPKKKFSNIGKTTHDAAWLKGGLGKTITKTKGDKEVKHKSKFKGTPAQMNTVIKWLLKLK